MSTPDPAGRRRGLIGVALAMLVACTVYLPRLGADGLVDSEGHRAVTGWELRDRVTAGDNDLLVTTLFETPYLRKPPGVPWLMALSAQAFGESAWSARFVSAMAMILAAGVAAIAAWAWFGSAAAIWAGCAQALMPLFWQSGRAAEIEAANNLATQVACFACVAAACARPRGIVFAIVPFAMLLAIAMVFLMKGPASATVLIAILLATRLLVQRSSREEARAWDREWGWIWGAIWGFAILGLVFIANRLMTVDQAVTQAPSAFLFEPGKIPQILAMPFVALASALPMALLMPAVPPSPEDRRDRIALSLVLGCLGGVVLLALVGVSNPRYAMPAFVLLPPLAGYAAVRYREFAAGRPLPPGEARRARIYGRVLVRQGVAWLIALMVGAQVYIWAIEPARDARSGERAGLALAEFVPEDAVVYAHELVEARPEVLHALRRAANCHVVWAYPFDGAPGLPEPGGYVAIRTDGAVGSREIDAFERAGLADRIEPIAGGAVHIFEFTLYRVRRMGPAVDQ
ncbi:MAG: glycosyltransferase family 39 protein [Planctomycetota bacterium]